MTGTVLVTGATGFLGERIVRELLLLGRDVVCLVRGEAGAKKVYGWRKCFANNAETPSPRLSALLGDVTRPLCGLTEPDLALLRNSLSVIIHCAAQINFLISPDVLDRVNVQGTSHAVGLARHCTAGRVEGAVSFHHVSTAYVAGKRSGVSFESEDLGRVHFRNSYEESKYRAEQAIRATADVPWTIYRPSIIIGAADDENPEPGHSLNPILKALKRAEVRLIPGAPNAPIDFVNLNYVAGAIAQLASRGEGAGRTYHLVSGCDFPTRLQSVIDMLNNELRVAKPPLRLIPPGLYYWLIAPILRRLTSPYAQKALRFGDAFLPYFIKHPVFDDRQTKQALGEGFKPAEPIALLRRIAQSGQTKPSRTAPVRPRLPKSVTEATR